MPLIKCEKWLELILMASKFNKSKTNQILMVNTLIVISPILLLLLIIVIFTILAYKEYLHKITKYTVNRNELENTYLKIITASEPLQINFDDDLKLETTIDEVDENSMIVPSELVNYSFLLNPIRLAIMKTLNDTFKFPSADLRKELNTSWGKFTPHVNQLIEKGYISSDDEFIDNSPRKILVLEEAGRQQFIALEKILKEIIS